jgi:hypothetical protein
MRRECRGMRGETDIVRKEHASHGWMLVEIAERVDRGDLETRLRRGLRGSSR